MKTWSYEEEEVVAKHYKKHIDNYRSKKPNWKLVEEIMGHELITHAERAVACRLRNFIALDEKAIQHGFYNAANQTQELFDKYILEDEEE